MGFLTLAKVTAVAATAVIAIAAPAEARSLGKKTLKDRSIISYSHKQTNALAVSPGRVKGLHPRLRTLIGLVQKRFGRGVTITSGCRSGSANRRAGGARGSLHLRCMAADIRVAGVSERALLAVARSLPGVGGVGTYCRNSIVHIDVGPRREWHQGCGKGKRRRA